MINIEKSGRGFFFVKLGTTSIWLNKAFVPYPEAVPGADGRGWLYPFGQVSFPLQCARVERTASGNVVIRPDPNCTALLVEVASGYRGTASISSIAGVDVVWRGEMLHSPRGSLGCTKLALCNCAPGGAAVVRGTRTGRRVENCEVTIRVHADGRIEELVQDELAELLS